MSKTSIDKTKIAEGDGKIQNRSMVTEVKMQK